MAGKKKYATGEPCWVDLGVPDVDAATRFYGELLGWSVETAGPDAGGYAMARLDGDDVAGLGPQQAPGTPYWTTYFATDDADETAKRVKDAGGQVIVPPMDVMTAGRMAVFMDDVGAVFSVWQPGEHTGADRIGTAGAFCWTEIYSADIEKTKKFYADVFGFEAKTEQIEGATSYTVFRLPGADRDICGMFELSPEMAKQVPPHWLVNFAVSDCDATVEKAKSLGGNLIHGPMDVPNVGRFAIVSDQQGASFSVIKLG